MPKNSTHANSMEELAKSTTQLDEIKLRNKESKQIIQKIENEKLLDDAESLRDNARVINALGKFLVWIFFGSYKKIYFIFLWIIAYVVLNIFFLELEKGHFYISLIDKIGLFLIVCILGKFLKDNISNIIKVFQK